MTPQGSCHFCAERARFCERWFFQHCVHSLNCSLHRNLQSRQLVSILLFDNTILSYDMQRTKDSSPPCVCNEFSCTHTLIAAICLQENAKLTAHFVFGEVNVHDGLGIFKAICVICHHSPQYSRIAASTIPKSLGIFSEGNIPSGLLAVVYPSDCVTK